MMFLRHSSNTSCRFLLLLAAPIAVYLYSIHDVVVSLPNGNEVVGQSSSSSSRRKQAMKSSEESLRQALGCDTATASLTLEQCVEERIQQQQQQQQRPPPTERNETCIFVLATPGSGSSTMVQLLNDYTPCTISGENSGALLHLANVHAAILATERMPRGDVHAEAAWHKVYGNVSSVIEREHALVRSLLNPHDTACWGFKEIRYGRMMTPPILATAAAIRYLQSLCAHPKIILHTRTHIEPELQSHVLRGRPGEQAISRRQRACFQVLAATDGAGSETIVLPEGESKWDAFLNGCKLTTPHHNHTILSHTLDEYLEGTATGRFWDYLGFPDPHATSIVKITTPDGKQNVSKATSNAAAASKATQGNNTLHDERL